MPRSVALTGSFDRCEQPTDRPRLSSGLQTQSQIGYPQQIVSPSHEISPRLRPFHSAIATAPKPAHRFHPAKDLFHPFANALTGAVTRPTGRASIQSRSVNPISACRVRRHGPLPTSGHKFLLVIRLVRTEGRNLRFVH